MKKLPIKIGVIGVGHLGQHHVKHLKSIKEVNLIGIYDKNEKQGSKISKKYSIKNYSNMNDLIADADALSIVTPTSSHGRIAANCINKNKHVFIEKPITSHLSEADELLKLSHSKSVVVQVGHIERCNPALMVLKAHKINPKFIEIQRLAPYTARGTDVPVVLDKMIHDIDIVLSLVKSDVKSIRPTGLSIITDSLDVAHARIRFQNGTVASMTSSRISQVEVRKVKLFQRNLYTTTDLLKGVTEIYSIVHDNKQNTSAQRIVPFNYGDKQKLISYEKPAIKKNDALSIELNNFVQSILGNELPIVDALEARNALEIALKIQQMIIKDIH